MSLLQAVEDHLEPIDTARVYHNLPICRHTFTEGRGGIDRILHWEWCT